MARLEQRRRQRTQPNVAPLIKPGQLGRGAGTAELAYRAQEAAPVATLVRQRNRCQRLGLIRDEADEAALPPGYEALLVPEDGLLRPADLVEDELVLAVPVVPLAPDAAPVDRTWSAGEEEMQAASPFAALASLKKK